MKKYTFISFFGLVVFIRCFAEHKWGNKKTFKLYTKVYLLLT